MRASDSWKRFLGAGLVTTWDISVVLYFLCVFDVDVLITLDSFASRAWQCPFGKHLADEFIEGAGLFAVSDSGSLRRGVLRENWGCDIRCHRVNSLPVSTSTKSVLPGVSTTTPSGPVE